MEQIIRRFRPLARRLARLTGADWHSRKVLENAAYMALVRAVRRHDVKRVGFPSFAEAYMRGAVWREHRRLVPERDSVGRSPMSIVPEATSASAEELVHERLAPWDRDDLARAIADLSLSQRHIVIRRYVDDAPLALIAEEVGTSSSAVSQRLSTVHRIVATAISN
ncbi:MAG: sigma-70 family RNA polymerase sigma factor [Thermoleophilia bacterium]|nr:sigma-70 family RNA polymerase sigma factor [Thermoleophilia bacterium]